MGSLLMARQHIEAQSDIVLDLEPRTCAYASRGCVTAGRTVPTKGYPRYHFGMTAGTTGGYYSGNACYRIAPIIAARITITTSISSMLSKKATIAWRIPGMQNHMKRHMATMMRAFLKYLPAPVCWTKTD